MASNLRVLGVCGGIGSGKSRACRLLVEELGCWAHLEADTIAHSVYQPRSPALEEIAAAFGPQILNSNDGTVNRQALGRVVFSSPERMAQLEQIVWPYVKQEIQRTIESYRQRELPAETKPILILEAAVLVDAGWEDLLDGLWVVKVSPGVALDRLVEFRGLTKEEAQKRIEAQESRRGIGNLQVEIDNGVVSSVITNDKSLEELRQQLAAAVDQENDWYSK